ncbi:MAG: site-2 protease family protein [Alphaproteobacteria bacterium]
MFSNISLYTIVLYGIPVILAITLHEAAHAWTAHKLGDNTAKSLGRVTANPIKHIDPVGTILVPLMLVLSASPFIFGWAKPVPVRFGVLGTKNISMRLSIVLVAAAGPISNLLMALAAALLTHLAVFFPSGINSTLLEVLSVAILVNVFFAVFNMIPIPPLDGGRIATGLLPANLAWPLMRLERYGFIIILVALIGLPYLGNAIGIRLDFASQVLSFVLNFALAPFFAIGNFGL